MAKLTKAQAKLHEKAVKLLQCKELSEADTRFVFNHYREDANHINSTAGAFFTPYGLARDFRLHIPLNYKDHHRSLRWYRHTQLYGGTCLR